MGLSGGHCIVWKPFNYDLNLLLINEYNRVTRANLYNSDGTLNTGTYIKPL